MNSPASRSVQLIPPLLRKDTDLTATIIICTRNRVALLRKCLEALEVLEPPADEILVVDNSTGDTETELTAREFGAHYIVEPTPGLSRARNRGFAESSTDIVAYLDDDAVPDKSWLRFILDPFKDARVAVVSGDTLCPESTSSIVDRAQPRTISNQVPLWFEMATFGGLGFGTNMALRKSACGAGKIFDERLGRGAPLRIAEESHVFASLLERGFSVVHVPAAVVIHPEKPRDVEIEATSSMAYWLLLFFEFPRHRFDLLRFLFSRLMGKPLSWTRDPQGPGEIVSSSWRLHLKAGLNGALLYFRNRRVSGS